MPDTDRTTFEFVAPDLTIDAPAIIAIGTRQRLGAADVIRRLPAGATGVWTAMLSSLRPGDKGDSATTWLAADGDRPAIRLTAAALPEATSRHNAPARTAATADLMRKLGKGRTDLAIIAALEQSEHAFAVGCALARAFPLYTTRKPAEGTTDRRRITVAFTAPDATVTADARLEAAVEGVRLAARLVDTPTSEMGPNELVAEAERVAAAVGARCTVIRGHELRDQGFGGLWGVGKAATAPPALVILSHEPETATKTVCWVGKGIVYDTGGLSIKDRNSMPGMKRDMGGAAAVLAAFGAAVKSGAAGSGNQVRLHALLCIAENSVGPEATRPDDILYMYSGKSVEVNNTDAEGRLVLGDGVAYATKHLSPDVVIDIATLTGAQLIATGRQHAAIVCNDEALERRTIAAGLSSGDLVHPLPYCPEMFRSEFESEVADLKNSVKDRTNAQSSCAAQFVAEHLVGYTGPWLHVDMAGPSHAGERATGYGVALLLELARD